MVWFKADKLLSAVGR